MLGGKDDGWMREQTLDKVRLHALHKEVRDVIRYKSGKSVAITGAELVHSLSEGSSEVDALALHNRARAIPLHGSWCCPLRELGLSRVGSRERDEKPALPLCPLQLCDDGCVGP